MFLHSFLLHERNIYRLFQGFNAKYSLLSNHLNYQIRLKYTKEEYFNDSKMKLFRDSI